MPDCAGEQPSKSAVWHGRTFSEFTAAKCSPFPVMGSPLNTSGDLFPSYSQSVGSTRKSMGELLFCLDPARDVGKLQGFFW